MASKFFAEIRYFWLHLGKLDNLPSAN